MTRSLILAALALGLLATAAEARSRYAIDDDYYGGIDPSIPLSFNPRPIGPTFYAPPVPLYGPGGPEVTCRTQPHIYGSPQYGSTTTCR